MIKDVKVDGRELTIRLELEANPELSSSGKNYVLFKTGGFVALPGTNARINMNIISKSKELR